MNIRTLTTFAFVLFLVGSAFKENVLVTWLPFDPTVGGAAMIAGLVLWDVARRAAIPRAIIWPLLLFVAFLPGVLLADLGEFYATDKVLRLFTLTLLAATAPIVLLRRPGDVDRLGRGLTLAAAVLTAGAFVVYARSSDIFRLTAGGDPIPFGRTVGAGCIWLLLAWLRRGDARYLPVVGPMAFVLVASATRGPLLAAIGAAGYCALRFHGRSRRSMKRLVALAVLLVIGATLAADRLPTQAVERIQLIMADDPGIAVTSRKEAYRRTGAVIATTPLGVGWAGFGDAVGMWTDRERQYPHNLLLEIALEDGWIPALLFTVLLLAALWRAHRAARHSPEGELLFAMLVFFALNAMVSLDVNGQRPLFTFMAVALIYRSPSPHRSHG